jgi:1-acyl-sn-glycerol-3-phosphate acyltransferase
MEGEGYCPPRELAIAHHPQFGDCGWWRFARRVNRTKREKKVPKVEVTIVGTAQITYVATLNIPKKVLDADEVQDWVDENRPKWETSGNVDNEDALDLDEVTWEESED